MSSPTNTRFSVSSSFSPSSSFSSISSALSRLTLSSADSLFSQGASDSPTSELSSFFNAPAAPPPRISWGEKWREALNGALDSVHRTSQSQLHAVGTNERRAILGALDYLQEKQHLLDLGVVCFSKVIWGVSYESRRAFLIYKDKDTGNLCILIKPEAKYSSQPSHPGIRVGGTRHVKKGAVHLTLKGDHIEAYPAVTVSQVRLWDDQAQRTFYTKDLGHIPEGSETCFLKDGFRKLEFMGKVWDKRRTPSYFYYLNRSLFFMKDLGDPLGSYIDQGALSLDEKKAICACLFNTIKWGETFDIKVDNILYDRNMVVFHDTHDPVFTYAIGYSNFQGHYKRPDLHKKDIYRQQIFNLTLVFYEIFNGIHPHKLSLDSTREDKTLTVRNDAVFAKELIKAFKGQLSWRRLKETLEAVVLQD